MFLKCPHLIILIMYPFRIDVNSCIRIVILLCINALTVHITLGISNLMVLLFHTILNEYQLFSSLSTTKNGTDSNLLYQLALGEKNLNYRQVNNNIGGLIFLTVLMGYLNSNEVLE